jgi:hypothetical protein
MEDFTRAEAEAKTGKRVRARVDGAFFEDALKKGMEGTVSDAAPSPYVRNDTNDVWTVSVEFDNKAVRPIPFIHKEQYEEHLEEVS